MEADVVEPVLTALEEDARPRGFVDRWIAGLGEAAVLDCAAQPYRLTVEQELTATDGDVANAEGDGERLAAVDEGVPSTMMVTLRAAMSRMTRMTGRGTVVSSMRPTMPFQLPCV